LKVLFIKTDNRIATEESGISSVYLFLLLSLFSLSAGNSRTEDFRLFAHNLSVLYPPFVLKKQQRHPIGILLRAFVEAIDTTVSVPYHPKSE